MTTYAPKFPSIKVDLFAFMTAQGPILNYERLIRMRNAKVSIGARLNYGS